MDGPHKRTLEKALELVGSQEQLAAALDLSVNDLKRYLNGDPLPHKVFIDALEIVAHGQRPPQA